MTEHLPGTPTDLPAAPLISTVARGGRMTRVAPGRRVGRMDGRLVALLAGSGAVWAAAGSVPFVVLLGLAPGEDAEAALDSPGALVATVVLAGIGVVSLLRLRAGVGATFGQARVTHLASSLAVTGGLTVCAAAWFVTGLPSDAPPFDLDRLQTATTVPRELGVLVGAGFAAWSVLTIVLLVIAVRSARTQQHRLDELLRSGDRFAGVLDTVHFRQQWLRDQPQFTIQVAWTSPDGPRRVEAHLLTDASQVPVVGSPMIVLTDRQGTVHVDLDHAAGVTYVSDHTRYEAPRD